MKRAFSLLVAVLALSSLPGCGSINDYCADKGNIAAGFSGGLIVGIVGAAICATVEQPASPAEVVMVAPPTAQPSEPPHVEQPDMAAPQPEPDLASAPPKPDMASPPDLASSPDLAIVRDFATPPPVVVKCVIDDKWKAAELPALPPAMCASPVRLAADCSLGCPPGKSADYIYPVYTRPLQGDLTHWELWAYSGAYSSKLDVGILPAGDCPRGRAYRFVGLSAVSPAPTAATVQGSTDLAEVYGYDPQYDKGVTYENCPLFGTFFTWGYKSQIAYKPAPAP